MRFHGFPSRSTPWTARSQCSTVSLQRGQHRLPLPDLIVAATAEFGNATVLHYDHDYDLIAGVTGQPTQWIVARGTGG